MIRVGINLRARFREINRLSVDLARYLLSHKAELLNRSQALFHPLMGLCASPFSRCASRENGNNRWQTSKTDADALIGGFLDTF